MTNIDNHGIKKIWSLWFSLSWHYGNINLLPYSSVLTQLLQIVMIHTECWLSKANALPTELRSSATDWAPEFTAYLSASIEQKLLVLGASPTAHW